MVKSYSLNNLPGGMPTPNVLNQDRFDRGVITVINESKLPRNALKTADNLTLGEDGAPMVRPGVSWFGSAMPNGQPIDGAAMFTTDDEDIHLVAVAGGVIYRSTDDAQTWTACTGASMTAGRTVRFEQARSHLYIFNGWDNIARYDGSTVLSTYTLLTAPTGTSVTRTGTWSTNIYTYRYRVSAVNKIGFTEASTAVSIGVDRERASFSDTNFTTFKWGLVAGAERYDIYVGQSAGNEVYIGSVDGTIDTYVDKGRAIEQVAVTAPTDNTTKGPRVGQMSVIGTRLYATQDRDFPHRVWISGAGRFMGHFSSAFEATYIDLPEVRPVKVEDYRDGKNDSKATVWCRSTDGFGAVWQGNLIDFTIGDTTFPVPNFIKLPGSRGTNAPDSVVNVLNDYLYYNTQAFYNLGSRAQFLNLLSTDEISADIRPNMKRIKQSASHKVAAFYHDAKVYFSVPINSDVNNQTIIYDTERKAWLPRGFTIGFERFFAYTDSESVQQLLAWKDGDTRLSRIHEEIRGDYGVPFPTALVTGLIPINPRNRFEFMWTEEGEIELANTEGRIKIELSGITRLDGFKKIAEREIRPENTKVSWTTARWTTKKWTDTNVTETSYSEPSLKRFFRVDDELNAYQYRIDTNTLDARYTVRTLQINGTETQAGKPRDWELLEI